MVFIYRLRREWVIRAPWRVVRVPSVDVDTVGAHFGNSSSVYWGLDASKHDCSAQSPFLPRLWFPWMDTTRTETRIQAAGRWIQSGCPSNGCSQIDRFFPITVKSGRTAGMDEERDPKLRWWTGHFRPVRPDNGNGREQRHVRWLVVGWAGVARWRSAWRGDEAHAFGIPPL